MPLVFTIFLLMPVIHFKGSRALPLEPVCCRESCLLAIRSAPCRGRGWSPTDIVEFWTGKLLVGGDL